MDEESEPTAGDVRAAAAAAVAPDPVTADLLAKHAAKEPLTPAEYGKISWVGRKFPWLAEKFGLSDGSAKPGAAPGNASPVAAGTPAQAPADGLAVVEIDSSFIERTTEALLRRTDAIAVRVIGNAAKKAGADEKQVARFERAAAMSADDKKLLAELTPECARAMGVDLRNYPLTVAGGMLGLYVADLTMLVLELKEMQAKREKFQKESAVAASAPATAQPAALPDPICK